MDRGSPISYLVLGRGTPVQSSDGVDLGTVRAVQQVPVKDVFDGIVIDTPAGRRFVDGPEVAEIYENLVVLAIDAEEAAELPKPGQNPAVAKLADLSGAGDAARRLMRRMRR
jgi:hypothetical protein